MKQPRELSISGTVKRFSTMPNGQQLKLLDKDGVIIWTWEMILRNFEEGDKLEIQVKRVRIRRCLRK